jgi:hypothetical protein
MERHPSGEFIDRAIITVVRTTDAAVSVVAFVAGEVALAAVPVAARASIFEAMGFALEGIAGRLKEEEAYEDGEDAQRRKRKEEERGI